MRRNAVNIGVAKGVGGKETGNVFRLFRSLKICKQGGVTCGEGWCEIEAEAIGLSRKI
jgi:hypothetical protein